MKTTKRALAILLAVLLLAITACSTGTPNNSDPDNSNGSDTGTPGNPSFTGEMIADGRAKGFVKLSAENQAYYSAIETETLFVPKTNYSDGSYSLCIANVVQFGAKGDGVTDDYQAFVDAIAIANSVKGGIVFVPEGTYYISKPLQLPIGVHLRGEYDTPDHTAYGDGTNIVTDYAQTGIYNTPFLMLSSTSGVRNIAFYYLNQNFENPVDYSPCVGINPSKAVMSATVQNIMVYNSTYPVYFGTGSGTSEINYVWATPLKLGFISDNDGGVANFANMHMDEKYYAECGFVGAPQNDADRAKLKNTLKDAIGFVFERHDAPFVTSIYSHGIGTGLIVRESSHPERYTWPNSGGYAGGCLLNTFEFTGCHTGIKVEEVLASATFTNGLIETNGDDGSVGIWVTDKCGGKVIANGVTIDGNPTNALKTYSATNMHFVNCDFNSWSGTGIVAEYTNLFLNACTFGGKGNEINADWAGSLGISGCTFASESPAISTTNIEPGNYAFLADKFTAFELEKNEPYQYAEKIPGPKKFDIFNVMDYDVDNTGILDATDGINAALKAAGDNGGGIVYVPVGEYRIDGTLNVPTGVEMRGVSEAANYDNSHYGWSMLAVYGGEGQTEGDGAIVLQEGSGLKGLYIYYPDQSTIGYQEGEDYIPYPFAVTAKGPNCYAIFVNGVNPYQMFDFGSAADCSNYYIYNCGGQPLRTGFFLGNNSGVGRVERCVFQLTAWAYTGLPYKPYFGAGTYDAEGMKTNALWSAFVWDLLDNCTGIIFGYNEKVYSMGNSAYAMGTIFKFVDQDGKCTKDAELFYVSADVTYDTLVVEKAEKITLVNATHNILLKENCGATVTSYGSAVNTVSWERDKNQGLYRVNGGKLNILAAGTSMYSIPCYIEMTGGEVNIAGGALAMCDINTLIRATGGKAELFGLFMQKRRGLLTDTDQFVTNVSGDAQVTLKNPMGTSKR